MDTKVKSAIIVVRANVGAGVMIQCIAAVGSLLLCCISGWWTPYKPALHAASPAFDSSAHEVDGWWAAVPEIEEKEGEDDDGCYDCYDFSD